MANPRFKPVNYVRQEEFDSFIKNMALVIDELSGRLVDLDRHAEVLELAVIKVAQDTEAISDALVEAGILEEAAADEKWDTDTLEKQPYDPETAFSRAAVDPDNPAHEVDLDGWEDEGGAPDFTDYRPSSPVDVEAGEFEDRAEAIRRAQDETIAAFQAANEHTEAEADTDPNSVTDVPEEGKTVRPGYDPVTGEERT